MQIALDMSRYESSRKKTLSSPDFVGFFSVPQGLPACVIGLKIRAGIPWTTTLRVRVFLSKSQRLESKDLQAYLETVRKRTQNGPGPFPDRSENDLFYLSPWSLWKYSRNTSRVHDALRSPYSWIDRRHVFRNFSERYEFHPHFRDFLWAWLIFAKRQSTVVVKDAGGGSTTGLDQNHFSCWFITDNLMLQKVFHLKNMFRWS